MDEELKETLIIVGKIIAVIIATAILIYLFFGFASFLLSDPLNIIK